MLNTSPFSVLVHEQAKRYGSRTAMSYRDNEKNVWIPVSWDKFSETVRKVSAAMLALKVGVQENLAVFSQNMPECLYVDFGAYGIRAVTIPFYATSSESQVVYMVNDAEIRYVFVGEQYQYDTAFRSMPHCPTLQKLIIFDPSVVRNPQDTVSVYFDEFLQEGAGKENDEELDRRASELEMDDLANILYTSGTTGVSKGVMLSHRMYHDAIIANDAVLQLSDKDVILNFLPFTHVFERAWSYLCLSEGARLAINQRPADILQSLQEVHPTCMCAVPRFWEKVYAGVKEKIAGMSKIQRIMVNRAVRCGKKRNLDYVRLGKKAPLLLEKEYRFWNKNIFQKLKNAIGIPNPNMFPTAGAPLSDKIVEFLRSVGIEVVIGYGLSETTATVSFYPPVGYEIGTVGLPLPGLDVKIDKNGEILVKGDTVTPGYYKNPVANEQAFTDDGYFRTGDAGYFTRGGALVLTERVKDLFKTSNGKYIAPQMLESRLAENKYIDEVAVIGDQRKFVSALIVPNLSQLRRWADEKGIDYSDTVKFVADPKVVEFVMGQINQVQQGVAEYEKIKRITLLPNHFSIMNGEVTNTMKVRRPIVAKRYAKEIEAMYSY